MFSDNNINYKSVTKIFKCLESKQTSDSQSITKKVSSTKCLELNKIKIQYINIHGMQLKWSLARHL